MTATATITDAGRLQYKTYGGRDDYREGLAKAFAEANGYYGAQGGWIYRIREGRDSVTVCQGWGSFYSRKRTAILDWLTKRITAAPSFFELVQAKGNYRPTILIRKGTTDGWMYEALAEAYDDAQRERKDPRRAHRGRPYYKLGECTGFLMPNHIVNGEQEGTGRGICGMLFEKVYQDLTARNIERVTCGKCRRIAGLE